MGLKLADIKFTDKSGPGEPVVTYGTCPEKALSKWLERGFEKVTPEEVAAAAKPQTPTEEDLANGLILDDPADGPSPVVVDEDLQIDLPAVVEPPVVDVVSDSSLVEIATSDSSDDVAGDSTAGDDADSKPDVKPARGGRRTS